MSDSNANKSDDENMSEDSEVSEICSKPVKYSFGERIYPQEEKYASQTKVSPSSVASRKGSQTFQSSNYQDINKKGFEAKSSGADPSSSLSFATYATDQSSKRTEPKSSVSVQNTKESRFFDSLINRCGQLWEDINDLEPRFKRRTGAFKPLSPGKPYEFKESSACVSFKTPQNKFDGTDILTEPSHQSQVEELSEARSLLKSKDYSTGNTSSGRTSQGTGDDSNAKPAQFSPPSTIEKLSQLTLEESSELEENPAASDSSSRGATFSDSAEPRFAPSAGKIEAMENLMSQSFDQFNRRFLELKQKVTSYLKEIECMIRNCPAQTKSHVIKKYETIDLELVELQTTFLNCKAKIEAGHLKNMASQSSSIPKDDKTEDSEYVSNLHRKYRLAENFIKLMEKFQEINESVHMFLSKFVNWN